MADKSLSRVYFAIIKSEKTGNEREGFFSCRLNVSTFLELTPLAAVITRERTNPANRSLTLAGGTSLTAHAGGTNPDGTAIVTEGPKSNYTLALDSKGSRTVIIKTGLAITDGAARPGSYHVISFRFPSWATIPVIADALGTIIPAGKIAASPDASQIYPVFKVKGGRRYPIEQQAAAQGDNEAVVPGPSETAQLVGKDKTVKALPSA